jgi:four helix bundle protein
MTKAENGKEKMENGNEGARAKSRKVLDFTDLETWKQARHLRRLIYQLTAKFPQNENFALTSQMRRAVVSITANIAEGFGRYSYQENIQFCRQSRGSTYEIRDHLTASLDAGYISKLQYETAEQLAMSVIRLINGYIKSTKNLKAASAAATDRKHREV